MRRVVRRAAFAGLLAGLLYWVWRGVQRRRALEGIEWQPSPFPYPPVPRVPETPGTAAASSTGHRVHVPDVVEPGGGPETGPTVVTEAPWIEPVDGTCPDSHPVKAKLASGIYHVRGGASYARTKPDRCYCDAAAAEADGFRPARA